MNCIASNITYNCTVTSKNVIGLDGLNTPAAKSRKQQVKRLFSFGAPFFGCPDRRVARLAGFCSAGVPVRQSCRGLPPILTVELAVRSSHTPTEAILANQSSSISAQISTLRDINDDANYALNSIAAMSWMAQIAIEHAAQTGIANGVAYHFKAIFESIQAQSQILIDNIDNKVNEACESAKGCSHA